MQYRIDKRSGYKLSVLGYGCMRFPGTITGIDMRKTEELVKRSIEGGVNYFDTAWLYAGSEEALGTILYKNNVREKVYIATKLPLVLLRSPADFDKYLNHSLKRLKTAYIDYYLLHMISDLDQWTKLKSWGIEQWLAEKKKSGLIRQIGFSFHGSSTEFLKVIENYDWEFCMIQYNYSDENFQAGVTGLRKAAQTMTVMVMEPLLGGKLATGLPKEAVDIFKKANPELSPAGWGLNWVWDQEEVTLLTSGMSTMAQLEENLRLADTAYAKKHGEQETDIYRQALALINRNIKIQCTGCNYCMPCPKNVNIPGCLSAYNTMYSMGYVTGLRQFISSTGLISEQSGSPGLCTNCGLCETRCPQQLPIIKHLKQAHRRLEPFLVQFMGVCARAFMGRKRKKNAVQKN